MRHEIGREHQLEAAEARYQAATRILSPGQITRLRRCALARELRRESCVRDFDHLEQKGARPYRRIEHLYERPLALHALRNRLPSPPTELCPRGPIGKAEGQIEVSLQRVVRARYDMRDECARRVENAVLAPRRGIVVSEQL